MNFQILDVGSIWLKEFAAALTRRADTVCWQPTMRWLGYGHAGETESVHADPELAIRQFPLQRGYARFPVSALAPFGPRVVRRLRAQSPTPGDSVLICTTPYYAPVAERWAGPVVYYQTDKTVAYAGVNPRLVRSLDQRMCRVAHLVCPNSPRIADYLVADAWCAERKIVILPNATRASNIYKAAPRGAGPLPADVADLPRPIAGVIGNLAANMDWVFLRETVRQTAAFSWLFVGPTSMPVYGSDQNRARRELLSLGGRVRFIGSRPYGALQSYARSFDVAMLPYRLSEPTYSGSSTRFYEHLAACRPILATRGFAELLQKEPLLQLLDSPGEAARVLTELQDLQFADGREHERWRASFQGTWEARVETMLAALARLVPALEPQLLAEAR